MGQNRASYAWHEYEKTRKYHNFINYVRFIFKQLKIWHFKLHSFFFIIHSCDKQIILDIGTINIATM